MRSQDATTSFYSERTHTGHWRRPKSFFAIPDASDDQELFNDHIPRNLHFEPTPETVDREEIDTEHGIIYDVRAQRLTDRSQLRPILENSPQILEQQPDDSVVSTDSNDEYRVERDETAADDNELTNSSNRTQVTPRNNGPNQTRKLIETF